MRRIFLLIVVLSVVVGAWTQIPVPIQPDPPHRAWRASWITHPTVPLREPVVLHFRRSLHLEAVPGSYIVRVSADNRFVLFVNGKRVGDGPARGDLAHWRYERFDLAPLLKAGDNLITATVWNFGVYAPLAQVSDRTAFLLESEAAGKVGISTPEGWLVEIEPGQRPLDRSTVSLMTYFASGAGEQIDASRYDWKWNDPAATGGNWVPAASPMREAMFADSNRAHSADTTAETFWGLVPDLLPAMEYKPTETGKSAVWSHFTSGITSQSSAINGFPETGALVGSGRHVHLTLDRQTLTTAYPQLTVSGGKGAKITLTYAEALYDKAQKKADRDSISYKGPDGSEHPRTALGLSDSFLPDGGEHRVFEPLWWRTWRYLDIDIQTADQPLTLESLTANFTAYPFQERASFHSNDPELDKIWEISWRTARLDAHETYMDTPYYEQLQYVGDTRIQALISYAVTGDDRLARQAIAAFDQSRSADGLTRSRYPSSLPQTIPTFSLLWVGMVHDYWFYRPDNDGFVRSMLPGTRSVLDWFAKQQEPDGLLRELPWWSFVDWVSKGTIPTYSVNKQSCVTSLEYLGALNEEAELEQAMGDAVLATRDHQKAESLRGALYQHCWVASRGLIADNPDQQVFSQQANILSVLYDVIPKEHQREVMSKLLTIEPGTTPDGVLSASYYFRFYLARALEHAGMGDEYLLSLRPWRELLPIHFSTWPETPGDTRSDSHAWTAHPIYDLLTLVAGIEPGSPGFNTVRIAPHLGSLPSLTASYPHPQGMIEVALVRRGALIDATLTLPGKLTGSFLWNGRIWPLRPGVNRVHTQ